MALASTPAAFAVIRQETSVQGDWTLNRELTTVPPKPDPDARPRQRPRGGDAPGGGMPGGGPPGGGFGGAGGLFGGRGGPDVKERRALEAVRSRLEDIPERLVITIDGTRVQIVDAFGRATALLANGKKQERLTGDGEFTSTTKIDRGRLSVEEDFGRVSVTTTYERVAGESSDRLKVTLTVDGMPTSPDARDTTPAEPIVRLYDLKQ